MPEKEHDDQGADEAEGFEDSGPERPDAAAPADEGPTDPGGASDDGAAEVTEPPPPDALDLMDIEEKETVGAGRWTSPPVEMDRADEHQPITMPDRDSLPSISSLTSVFTDTTFSLANSPYTVADTLVIENTADLTVEAGVVIKMENESAIIVYGEIRCNGTADDPIIIEPAQPGGRWRTLALISTNSTAQVTHRHARARRPRIARGFLESRQQ